MWPCCVFTWFRAGGAACCWCATWWWCGRAEFLSAVQPVKLFGDALQGGSLVVLSF